MKDQKTKGMPKETSNSKTLIAYHKKRKYEDALQEQLKLHKNGYIAMVELNPCESKEYADELKTKRGFEKLIWLS